MVLPGKKEGKGQETEGKAGRAVWLFWPNLRCGGESIRYIGRKKWPRRRPLRGRMDDRSMRHKLKPLLSALLTIAMLLSLLPTAVFAAGGTGTFTKITTQEELTDGKYVIVVDSGYAMGALDGTWLTATQVTEEGGSLTDPDASLVWEIAVTDSGVTLTDANGTQVAPKGGNNNGIQAGDYTWAISFENGTFRFLGTGEDTVTLASNKNSENKFRAYKNATINAGYPCDFTLYQYAEGTGTPDPGPGPDEPTVISISDALAAADGTEKLTVKGVVTLLDGQNVYLQDSTGGICARMSGQFDDIALGDTVIATGKRDTYNGLPQLGSATYEKSSGLTLTPAVKTIGELTDADICTYVTIEDVTVTEIFDNNGQYANPNITVEDAAGNTIQLYKAVVDKTAIAVNDVITITAAVSVFNGTFQLRNTSADEIQTGGASTGPIYNGEQVVIYNPAYGKALSGSYNGFYNNGTDVTLEDGTLSGFTAADVWTVADNGDGTWSFSYNGQNIGMGDSFSSMPLGEKNDKWVLEDAGNGLYYIKNTVRGAYMEWYAEKNNWSSYGKISAGSEGMFALTFYEVTDLPEPPSGEVPEDGAQVVLYNEAPRAFWPVPTATRPAPPSTTPRPPWPTAWPPPPTAPGSLPWRLTASGSASKLLTATSAPTAPATTPSILPRLPRTPTGS